MLLTGIIVVLAVICTIFAIRSKVHVLDRAVEPHVDITTTHDATVQIVTGLCVWFAVLLGGSLAIGVFSGDGIGDTSSALGLVLPQFIGACVGVGLCAACAVYAFGRPATLAPIFNSWRGLWLAFGLIPIALSIGMLALAVARSASQLLGYEQPDGVAHQTLEQLTEEGFSSITSIGAIIAVVFIAPIIEEVLYRGMFQRGLSALLGNTSRARWTSIIIVSTLFTLMHIPAVPAHALPVLWSLSIGFGVLYERSGALALPIISHVVFNASNIVFAMLAHGAA